MTKSLQIKGQSHPRKHLANFAIIAAQGGQPSLQLYVSSYAVDGNIGNQTGFLFFVICIVGNIMEEGERRYGVRLGTGRASGGAIAASARLEEAGNEAKKDAVLKILDFISTEEGQSIIRSNSVLANSFLDGVQFELGKDSNLVDILRSGAYGPEPVFARGVETAMGEAFGALLKGEITAAEAVAICDTANGAYVEQSAMNKTSTVLGTATAEFPWTFRDSRTKELAVTNFMVDCMREAAETNLAIELGTTVRGEFFQGEITDQDILSVLRQDKNLYRMELTGQQLWDIIEQGVIESNSSWFITVSGMKYRYMPAQGEAIGKLLTLEMTDGTPIELDQTYLVAVSENQMMEVPGMTNFFGMPAEELPVTLREAVAQNIQKQGEISPLLDGRISVVKE